MKDEIRIYEHPQFGDIRTTGDADEPLFCALDVCNALGYANSRKATADHVDDEDVTKRYAWVAAGERTDGVEAKRKTEMTFINESGLYSLIFGSTLPAAKTFKRWVTKEVLPAIRKTGQYSIAETQSVDACQELDELRGRHIETLQQLSELRGKHIDTLEQLRVAEAERHNAWEEVKIESEIATTAMNLPPESHVTTRAIADRFALSEDMINARLVKAGVVVKRGQSVYLTRKYADYSLAVNAVLEDHGGTTINYLKWTKIGQLFLFLLHNHGFNVEYVWGKMFEHGKTITYTGAYTD